jgi:hypothetical protein
MDRSICAVYLALSLRSVRNTPAADGGKVGPPGRQNQGGAALARLGAKGVPTFTTEMHRLVIEPNQAVHASPISLADNLQAWGWLSAVYIRD